MSTQFAPAKFKHLGAQKSLSEATTRVLRMIADQGDVRGLAYLLEAVDGNERRLFDALLTLERRWLITWPDHGRTVVVRQRGRDLLRMAAYRTRGLIT